ncbi:amino acid permease [Risungbinella massiliensis]|uniref:amino acid permease n=1 Tax=Risungbinella massiliensis TaxID=1329796 RepID=UPI00069995E8|nr:amino acid permease [Risungbinella massiliensis]
MSRELEQGLSSRHLHMLAIGGTIGAGIFQGSADSITMAGPGVVFAYLVAGIILFFVMSSLAEMASAHPGVDFRGLIHKALGYRVSFVAGWMYWTNWVIVIAVEIVAAGSFLNYFFPTVPIWMLSAVCAFGILLLNLLSVRVFGEVEFWLSAVKVAMLILFVFLGAYLLFLGGSESDPAPGLTNYTAVDGFFPNGITGVITCLVIVIFSFGGSEMIGLTLSEVKDSQLVLPKVLRGVIVRISLFYIFPVLIIVGLVPWNEVGNGESPFVQVLSTVGLNGAASVMNFVMLVALLSAANSGMYATSRLLYSLAKDGEAPRFFTKLSRRNVPIYGIFASTVFLCIGVYLSFVAQEKVFSYLMGIPGSSVIIIWMLIILSQIRLRKTYQETALYLSFHPIVSWIAVGSLGAILVAVVITNPNIMHSVIAFGIMAILIVCSFFLRTNQKFTNQDSLSKPSQ